MLSEIELKNFLRNLPSLPGIYKHLDVNGNIIYVGKAKNLKKRVSSYFNKIHNNFRIDQLISRIDTTEITITSSEEEALLLENNLIKKYKPRYNILFRDDKSYPYILISNHKWAMLSYYRGNINNKKGNYFGPYPNSKSVKETIIIIQKIFRLRTCGNSELMNRSRPCLLYQINKCSGPCTNMIDHEKYTENTIQAINLLKGETNGIISNIQERMIEASNKLNFEYASVLRDQIISLNNILRKQSVDNLNEDDTDIIAVVVINGRACLNLAMVRNNRHLGDKLFFPDNVEEMDESSIIDAFINQHYYDHEIPKKLILSHVLLEKKDLFLICEKLKINPPKIIYKPKGIKLSWLEQAKKNANFALSYNISKFNTNKSRLFELLDLLQINKTNMNIDKIRIECFDVSHFSGEATQASCVVFENCDMQPSMYKKYNILGIKHGDDLAAMKQVLQNRYKKSSSIKNDIPNIVLIDGGKNHVNLAYKIMNNLNINVDIVIGISKGEKRRPGLETLVFADGRDSLTLGEMSKPLMLINKIRDEAHRFAIKNMRSRFAKTRNKSKLESIKGIGMRRRQILLNRFGGLSGLTEATIEEISSIKGISKSLAEVVYNKLHN